MRPETVTLEKLKFGFEQRISPFLLDAQVDVDLDREINMIVARFTGSLFSERVDTIQIEYPSDWWQAFKQRWFPKWAKRYWPVNMTHHYIDVKVAYPDFRYSVQGQRLWVVKQDTWNNVGPLLDEESVF